MRKALLALVCLTLLVVTVGCGETVTPEKASKETTGASTQPNQPQYFKVGDRVKMGDLAITVNSVKKSQGGEFLRPQQGHVYVIVDCTIENLGNEPAGISSLVMFKLADSNGYNYAPTIAEGTKGQLDGEIGVGRMMRGEIAFEVPSEAQGLELIFEPNLFGFGQAIFKLNSEEV